jgi:hypothetical protein
MSILAAAAMLALAVVGVTPASAAEPAVLSPRAGADLLAARMPAPFAGGVVAEPSSLVLALPKGSGGVSTNEVIVCTGSVELRVGTVIINYVRAQAKTTCPVLMDWIVAQAFLYEFSALTGQWMLVAIGTPDAGPGISRESSTPDFFCSDASHNYAAVSYHYVRLGEAIAFNWFGSPVRSCSARLPF